MIADPMTSVLVSSGEALEAANTEWWEGSLALWAETFRVWVESLPVINTSRGDSYAPRSGGGITQEQFEALGVCEQGGRDNPYFGRYSIMDGSAGGKSLEQQQAQVQDIFNRYGASAWSGCAYTLR